MNIADGREIANRNDFSVLAWLHRFGWLRTRDIAALGWMPRLSKPHKGGYTPTLTAIPASALRMAQRTMRRLKGNEMVIDHRAPDGSTIYGLTEASAKLLRAREIPAVSARELVRRFSDQHYHHRRISNEIAITAVLAGYRVATEREIAVGHWLIGHDGYMGKKPDGLIRVEKSVVWLETQLSRKNATEYAQFLNWLSSIWPPGRNIWMPGRLPDEYGLKKVLLLANQAFLNKLQEDLSKLGWTEELFSHRIQAEKLLYPSQAKYLILEGGTEVATPSD